MNMNNVFRKFSFKRFFTLIELLVAKPAKAMIPQLREKATARVIRAMFTLIELLVAKPANLSRRSWTKAEAMIPRLREKATARVIRAMFTLIELLVVIAIISILMTILLPALRKCKIRTKTIACISNLRQVGTHASMYANDWSGYLPLFCDPSSVSPRLTWVQKMLNADYLEEQKEGQPSILVCPLQFPMVYCGDNTSSSCTYGMRDSVGYSNINLFRIDDPQHLEAPSKYPMFGDSRKVTPSAASHYQWYYFSVQTGSAFGVHLRHSGKANFWFVDGSARSEGLDFLVETNMQCIINSPYDSSPSF